MSEYSGVFNDILYRLDALSIRVAKLETFEQPRYGQHLYKTAAQAIALAAWTPVVFPSTFWSNGDYSASPADTFVAPVAGRYLIIFRTDYTTASVSLFNTRINHNGTYFHVESENPSVTGLLFIKNTTVLNLAKGDTVTIEANNAGDPQPVNLGGSADPYQTYFQSVLL